MSDAEPVKSIVTPDAPHLRVTPPVGAHARFLDEIVAAAASSGQRCPSCRKVYVPARGACPRCGVATEEEVEVAGKGTVTTFCIVRVPSENIHLKPPYVAAHILLDGADIPFFGARRRVRARRSAHGHARRGGLGAARELGADAREHPALPADRRARRRRSRSSRSTCDARRRGRLVRADAVRAPASASRNEVEMLMPVVARGDRALRHPEGGDRLHLLGQLATTSPGQAFAFVGAVDALGAWPPISRVARRDGRRLGALRGVGQDPDAATRTRRWCSRSGARRWATLPETLTMQLDPYTLAPLGVDAVSLAALQARAVLDAGLCERARHGRGRGALAGATPSATRTRSSRATSRSRSCWPSRIWSRRCASTTARRSPTARRRWCSPPATWRARVCRRPAWIRGIDHRIEPHQPGVRDLTALALDGARREEGRRRQGAARPRRAARALHAPGADPARARSALARERAHQPVGRPARGEPDDGGRAARIGEAAQRIHERRGRTRARARDPGPLPAAEPGLRAGGRVMAEHCAVIGVGQTQARRQAHRRVAGRARARGGAARARRRGARLEGHRRGRDRQGARPVRGRDDARAVPRRGARRRGQADAARAHGRQRRRLDGDRRGEPGAGGRARARAHRRLREAVREQRDVGALDPAAVPAGRGGGRGRLLRAADPRLHPARERARGHRHPRRAEGPPERAQESVRAPQVSRHHLRAGRAARRCCGTRSATSRPARRRTAPARWCSASAKAAKRAPRKPAWVHAHGDAHRADAVRRPRPGEPAGRARTARRSSTRRPASRTRASEIDCAEIYVPFSWFEPMWMENLGFAPERRGLEDDVRGRDRARTATSRSTCRAACSPRTRSAPRACCASPRPRTRCAASPASTRSTARAARSATPTAAARSTSRCGSWETSRSSGASRRVGSAARPRRRRPRAAPSARRAPRPRAREPPSPRARRRSAPST